MAEFPPDRYPPASSPEAYADLVTVAGFKPVVATEKPPGGFDSLPLPFAILGL